LNSSLSIVIICVMSFIMAPYSIKAEYKPNLAGT
jgi:hypothetical protein